MSKLPIDISRLVLTYTTRPIYNFPNWVDKSAHKELIRCSMLRPRAWDKILKYAKSDPEFIIVKYLAGNKDPRACEYILSLDKETIFNNKDACSCNPNSKFLDVYRDELLRETPEDPGMFYGHIIAYSSSLDFILEIWDRVPAEKKKFLSANTLDKVVEYLKAHPDLIDPSIICRNPKFADYIIEKYKSDKSSIDFSMLSHNPSEQIEWILDENFDKKDWPAYFLNPLARRETLNLLNNPIQEKLYPYAILNIIKNYSIDFDDIIRKNLSKVTYEKIIDENNNFIGDKMQPELDKINVYLLAFYNDEFLRDTWGIRLIKNIEKQLCL